MSVYLIHIKNVLNIFLVYTTKIFLNINKNGRSLKHTHKHIRIQNLGNSSAMEILNLHVFEHIDSHNCANKNTFC